jgi:hypothetical protein
MRNSGAEPAAAAVTPLAGFDAVSGIDVLADLDAVEYLNVGEGVRPGPAVTDRDAAGDLQLGRRSAPSSLGFFSRRRVRHH